MILIEKYTELSLDIRTQLDDYINTEFGHIPIVNETEWATPDWTIIEYEAKQILAFYNIVLREISIDGKLVKAGGVNNVITPKEFRGNGYSMNLLRSTEYLLFEEFNCVLGLLFCAEEMIPFYQRLNWYKVDSEVAIDQKQGKVIWRSNTMLLSGQPKIIPSAIDVNGLPW